MVELIDVSKYFGGVLVLKSVSTTFYSGEIHGLVGENGAGKSTLMKILCGVYKNEQGSIRIDSKDVCINNSLDAYNLGIRIVHQDLSLINSLTVSENLFIHHMRGASPVLFLKRKELAEKALELLREWTIDIDPNTLVADIPIATRQLIEIARELSTGGRIFILDEPTSSLTEKEIEHLFKILRKLKEEDYIIIFISHRLSEMQELADRVTLLRNGEMIATSETKDLSSREMVRLIADKDPDELYPKFPSKVGGTACKAVNICAKHVNGVSIDVKWGEIVGVAGLIGAGRSELLRAIYGANPKNECGRIYIDGREVKIRRPIDAVKHGMAFLSEERGSEGIVPDMSVSKNMILLNIRRVVSRGLIDNQKFSTLTKSLIQQLNIVTANADKQVISQLSGGNQQKVLFGRIMALEPRILLVDEPTRGVDVGNKAAIYKILGEFVQKGGAVVMVSSELEELMGICDRIIVMNTGNLVGRFNRDEFDKEEILQCMMGLQVRQ